MGLSYITIVDFAAVVNVSTTTILKPFFDPGFVVDSLLFVGINTGASDAWLQLETSEDAGQDGTSSPDQTRTQVVSMPAGTQASFEVGPYRTRRYWRLSAYTTSPGFPTTTVKWKIVGVRWGYGQ